MFWLRRPPYLRWIAAGLILLTGLMMDLRGPDLHPYPFAVDTIPVGTRIDDAIEWKDIPAGLLPQWDRRVSGIAGSNVANGDPLLPSMLTEATAPDGWWSVPVPLPIAVAPGTRLRVRYGPSGDIAEGVVVGALDHAGFEVIGTVAFPEEDAAMVAAATADDALVVMIAHDSGAESPGG